MSKEAQRPFADTGIAYRQAVERLISQHPSITVGDYLMQEEVRNGSVAETPDSTSIILPKGTEIPLSVPVHKQDLPKSFRGQNMAQVYIFGEERVIAVGSMFGVTYQSVQGATDRSVKRLLRLSPQEGYDFRSLSFKKSHGGLDGQGVVGNIAKEVKSGKVYEDLLGQGFTYSQLTNARKLLAERGIQLNIPRSTIDWGEIIKLLGNSGTERVVLKELILEIPWGVYLYYRNSKKNPEGLFFNLGPLAREAGLRLLRGELDFVANYLRCKNVPIGYIEREILSGESKGNTLRYNITTKNFVDETIDLLRSAKGEHFDRMRARAEKRKVSNK